MMKKYHVISVAFSSLSVSAFTSNQLVPRIRLEDFDPTEYYRNGPTPLLIEGIMTEEQCEGCCDLLIQNAGDFDVTMQHQQNYGDDVDEDETSTTRMYDCTLSQSLDYIMYKSNSKDSFLTFCEGLLETRDDDDNNNNDGLKQLGRLVTQAREKAFDNNDKCWFDEFPSELRPSDAVIFAGAGATSTLHRDPFEWTGTSLCLEGSKIWRFVCPSPEVTKIDEALDSYRLDSIAFGEDGEALSAGWQSNLSLYRHRKHDDIPSARELTEIDNDDLRLQQVQDVAMDPDLLKEDTTPLQIHTAIQKPGDLLLIPAHWWHQTYGLEPSAAIASQRCGKHDARLVLQHILNQNGIHHVDADSILESSANNGETAKSVSRLFEVLAQPSKG